jgi:hypothetical protein
MARRQLWQIGSMFKIPQSDGTASLGQVVGCESAVLNSVTCAFFDVKVPATCPPNSPPPLTWELLIACLFTTQDLLKNGTWVVIGHSEAVLPSKFLPYEETRVQGWVGAKVHGSGNVMSFLNAYFGLALWDDWADPNYLDRLLIHPSKKPAVLRFKQDPKRPAPTGT